MSRVWTFEDLTNSAEKKISQLHEQVLLLPSATHEDRQNLRRLSAMAQGVLLLWVEQTQGSAPSEQIRKLSDSAGEITKYINIKAREHAKSNITPPPKPRQWTSEEVEAAALELQELSPANWDAISRMEALGDDVTESQEWDEEIRLLAKLHPESSVDDVGWLRYAVDTLRRQRLDLAK